MRIALFALALAGCAPATTAAVALPRETAPARAPSAEGSDRVADATLLEAVMRGSTDEPVAQERCYTEHAIRARDGSVACRGEEGEVKLAKRQRVEGRGDFVWIALGNDRGLCDQDHYLLAKIHVERGVVAVDAMAPVDLLCAHPPNLAAIDFPEGRGLVVVNESGSEHGGGEWLQIYALDPGALRKLGELPGTQDDGRPEDGEMRHEDVRVSYTQSSIVVDAHVKRSECPTPDACRLVEEKDERRTFGLVSGKLAPR